MQLPPDALPAVRHPKALAPGTPLPAHYQHCFGCGTKHPTGLHLAVVAGEGVDVSAVFTVTDDHQGAPGLIHGGVLAAAFDEALGFIMWMVGQVAVTRRLETDYLRPVPVGTQLHIHARCDGIAGRKVYVSAEGRNGSADGEVVARSSALFIAVGVEHFEQNGSPGVTESGRWRYNP